MKKKDNDEKKVMKQELEERTANKKKVEGKDKKERKH